ncbi:hypothetical protein EVAR_28314_1 [Eumeta japonica]|uniref:Uncharacterized protein n=1 Tax=Eumeta variegata TaxID=151549 RepID=A0A4C1VBY0_EUMVA|nr:hypothetical protein EVAR_28314_1 [Eumeta japonica]
MLRFAIIVCCLALSHGHAVLPLAVPTVPVASHFYHTAPLLAPYPLLHHGSLEHQLAAKGVFAHHLLKRSPHYVATPLAVTHQHATSALAPVVSVVKPAVVAPLVHALPLLHGAAVTAPLLHKSLSAAPLHYGALLPYASHYPYLSHY